MICSGALAGGFGFAQEDDAAVSATAVFPRAP
jgi:hypothetical protein